MFLDGNFKEYFIYKANLTPAKLGRSLKEDATVCQDPNCAGHLAVVKKLGIHMKTNHQEDGFQDENASRSAKSWGG